MNDLKFVGLKSSAAKPYAEQIAQLRIQVFAEWPYLYEGDLNYELNYLRAYFDAQNSFVALAMDGDKAVGASTAIWLPEADPAFQEPFIQQKIDPKRVCYYGESVLMSSYRGRGIGSQFMRLREEFARSLPGVDTVAFCAVVRPDDHPLKPADYRPLHDFWRKAGFIPRPEMIASYAWKDINEARETEKNLQFWLKELK